MLLQHIFLNWLELANFQRQKKGPWWKRLLEEKLKELSQDLDFVNNLLEKRNVKKKHKIDWKKNKTFGERDSTL